MHNTEYVGREKLEKAFSQIRKDMAIFHRDKAYAAGNSARWTFLILWLLVAITIHDLFDTDGFLPLVLGAIFVAAYRALDGLYIVYRAHQVNKQPLEPTFDTHVDLS